MWHHSRLLSIEPDARSSQAKVSVSPVDEAPGHISDKESQCKRHTLMQDAFHGRLQYRPLDSHGPSVLSISLCLLHVLEGKGKMLEKACLVAFYGVSDVKLPFIIDSFRDKIIHSCAILAFLPAKQTMPQYQNLGPGLLT